ncbi:MAG TPA: CocE/NonD family hydrolase [Bryobacteraceae bacterium]|jgi:putative CocE/NonD family hydrolase|nr:CocE/NonD family hydrolase [Bryobacteraceae bacterium]
MLKVLAAAIALATVLFLAAQSEEPGIQVNFQEVMIPMRDGARLQTVILSPKNPKGPLPFLIDRTPYGVPDRDRIAKGMPPNQRERWENYYNVYQNIRGRFKSEGTFVMGRPPHDPSDPKGVDETTDAWDTVDWLVKNIPNNNGRAGIAGTSYDGWTTVMAALNPHPALKAAIEQASPADQFLGDDFHHNGAFRLSYGFEYSALLETSSTANTNFKFDRADTFDFYLGLGPLSNADERYFHKKLPTWEDFLHHPNYDAFWRRLAFAPYLTAVKIPIIHTAGWWDQEDFCGPQKIYELLEKHDSARRNYFVAGPWNHGQWGGNGRRLGPLDFGSDTSAHYREHIFQPWFDYWLRDRGSLHLAEATAFETGTNEWREYDSWPPRQGVATRKLYFHEGRRLSFDRPAAAGYDEYVSDPSNPVPYRPRPIPPTYPGPEWKTWLVQDQRFVDHRPDVLTWETEPLAGDLRIAGDIVTDLYASTSGTDSDWAIKLIDVYPEDAPDDRETKTHMGGYELIVADEILRARFRDSFERPAPVPSGKVLHYTIDLHTNAHAFQKGHRIMVQAQSTWFPVYDRNPQKFVPNIYEARASDYIKATQRIYRGGSSASAVFLPVVK